MEASAQEDKKIEEVVPTGEEQQTAEEVKSIPDEKESQEKPKEHDEGESK